MSNLHEESIHQRLSDVGIELLGVVDRDAVNLESFHGPLQLGSNIIGLEQSTLVQVVVPRPVFVITIWMVAISAR